MIKLIVFDFDGVFTNGKIYMTSDNKTFKSYHARDGLGISILLKNNYKLGLISGNNSISTKYIAKHLGFHKITIDCHHKLKVLTKWKNEFKLEWSEIAYMGDDLIDLPSIQAVGLSACPSNAILEIKKAVSYICHSKGGNGAVREFCHYIIDYDREFNCIPLT
jgi:3-deoxy-D-manno-octulosonate 8-phosphate phosphatase (KDO 8-P phosphatase)